MAVTYNKLWKTLIDLGLKRTDIITKAGISTSTLAKLGKNEYVNLEVISRICCALDIEINDVVEIMKDKDSHE